MSSPNSQIFMLYHKEAFFFLTVSEVPVLQRVLPSVLQEQRHCKGIYLSVKLGEQNSDNFPQILRFSRNPDRRILDFLLIPGIFQAGFLENLGFFGKLLEFCQVKATPCWPEAQSQVWSMFLVVRRGWQGPIALRPGCPRSQSASCQLSWHPCTCRHTTSRWPAGTKK